MIHHSSFAVLSTWIATLVSGGTPQGTISGTVLDVGNQPVSGAIVILCDHATGIPVSRETDLPFVKSGDHQNIVFATTQWDGTFVFPDVPTGSYRLIAQSWPLSRGPIEQLLEVHGRIVQLHGVAPRVDVSPDAATKIVIRPLGTSSLDIITAPRAPNDETLVLVSTASLAADPILAFAAWSGSFMEHLLGGNRMPRGRTMFRGLPAGKLHVAAFAADNNPGFGGICCETRPDQTTFVSLPLIASWSDGHKEPPEELAELVQQFRTPGSLTLMEILREGAPAAAATIETGRRETRDPWSVWIPVLEVQVEMPNGDMVAVKDLVAASSYAKLLQQDEDRKTRSKQKPPEQLPVDPSVTYEQALRDLHEQLARDYPCFGLKAIDWQAVGERLLPRAQGAKDDHEFGLLCLEMVAALEDSHATLLPGAAQVPRVDFPHWDAGFACLVDDRGEPVLYYVAEASSAAAAGLQIGMTVQELNEVAAREAIAQTEERLKKYVGYSSERYLRYHAMRFFARQMQQASPVTLRVVASDGTISEFAMKAEHSAGYVPRLPVAREGISDRADVSWKMLAGDIGYLYVRRITAELAASLDQAVAELHAAQGLIIDVRGNSGGGFDANQAFRNFDLDEKAEAGCPRFTGHIALLIDARCISAGEGWASWFVARHRARLFGETTAGASARKTTYMLRNGLYQVRYPIKAYQGFLDRPIERRGLEPDVPLMPNAEDLSHGRDTVLEAARTWLLEQDA